MLTGAVILLLSLVGLLAIPLSLQFMISWPETAGNEVRLRWGFGLIRVGFTPGKPKRASESRQRELQQPRSKSTPARSAKSLSVLRQRCVRRRALRLARDVWHAVGKEACGYARGSASVILRRPGGSGLSSVPSPVRWP